MGHPVQFPPDFDRTKEVKEMGTLSCNLSMQPKVQLIGETLKREGDQIMEEASFRFLLWFLRRKLFLMPATFAVAFNRLWNEPWVGGTLK